MKNRMTALVLAVILLLAACAQKNPPPETTAEPVVTTEAETTAETAEPETTAETTAAPTEEPAEPMLPPRPAKQEPTGVESGEPVEEFWTGAICWQADDYEQAVQVSLPRLKPVSPDAVEIQEEIWDVVYPLLEETLNAREEGYSSMLESVGYETNIRDGVVSLLVWEEDPYDMTQYQVYNLDLETGKRLDTAEISGRLGYADWEAEMTRLVQQDYEKHWEGQPQDDFYKEQLKKQLSPENIGLIQIYLGEQTEIVYNRYSLAGADYYPVRLVPPG